jgi:aryl-alcohol dehydrogenase-like predicted oxidoreductase
MSGAYGPAEQTEIIATIGAALDAGISLLDTGDYHGMGHNELLIRQGLRGRHREGVVISVKFSALRAPDLAYIGIDGRPERYGTSWPIPSSAWVPTTSTSTDSVG